MDSPPTTGKGLTMRGGPPGGGGATPPGDCARRYQNPTAVRGGVDPVIEKGHDTGARESVHFARRLTPLVANNNAAPPTGKESIRLRKAGPWAVAAPGHFPGTRNPNSLRGKLIAFSAREELSRTQKGRTKRLTWKNGGAGWKGK